MSAQPELTISEVLLPVKATSSTATTEETEQATVLLWGVEEDVTLHLHSQEMSLHSGFFPVPPSGPWIKAPSDTLSMHAERRDAFPGWRKESSHIQLGSSARMEPRASQHLFLPYPYCEPPAELLSPHRPAANCAISHCTAPQRDARRKGGMHLAAEVWGCQGSHRRAISRYRSQQGSTGHDPHLLHGSSTGSAPPARRGGRADCGCSASVSAHSAANWRYNRKGEMVLTGIYQNKPSLKQLGETGEKRQSEQLHFPLRATE